jgi:general secretion pathway protein A
MYEQHWSLKTRPFAEGRQAEGYVATHTHQGALLKLRYLVEQRQGAGVLVGEHGLGKSYVTRVLEADCRETQAGPFVRLLLPQLSPAGILAYWAHRMGAVIPSVASEHDVLLGLERRLAELCREGLHPVLVVDDAHLLDVAHLDMLRLALNLRESGDMEFSIILAGRPELLGLLEMSAGLAQRIAVRAGLDPLDARETADYISSRMKTAGGTGEEFSPAAALRLWQLSQGVPRRINQLCELTLLVGFADALTTIGAVEVDAAAEELLSVSVPRAA